MGRQLALQILDLASEAKSQKKLENIRAALTETPEGQVFLLAMTQTAATPKARKPR